MLKRPVVILFPVAGIIIFIMLYLMAASLYPDDAGLAGGFRWLRHYWCDLLSLYTAGGVQNPSRPLAIAGAAVLCFSLALLWYQVPLLFFHVLSIRRARNLGIASMCLAFFIFTDFHDDIIYLAGILGVAAHLILAKKLWQGRLFFMFWFTSVCLVLMSLNFLVYESGRGLHWLPVIQKITFLFYLTWAVTLNMVTYQARNFTKE